MKLFKILKDGKSCHGGNQAWSLPNGKPGDWQEVSGSLEMCKNGLHLTNKPFMWYTSTESKNKGGYTMKIAEMVETEKSMLLETLKPGDIVYTEVTHVARSGMSRRIKLFIVRDDALMQITHGVGLLLGYSRNDNGLFVSGCGMDMCFATVYHLGRVLFPKGFPVVERCDKCQDRPGYNGVGKPCKTCIGTGMKPARGRNGDMSGWDTDGGYALTCRSL